MFAVGIYFPFAFYRRSPRIIFDDEFITVKGLFGTKTYDWISTKSVRLSSKETFTVFFILGQQLEATTISFENGDEIFLWADMYSNLSELITFISAKVPDKILDQKVKIDNAQVKFIDTKVYKGNPYTSFNSLLILGMIIFFFVMLHPKPGEPALLLLPFGFVFILFIGFGTQMNYFIIENGELIIKNHYFFWKKKVYHLKEIREMVIETPQKRSDSLRIITNEFNSKLFGAGSLRNINWRELVDDITAIGIPIRADTYIGK
jgi:hypothetical protein